MVTRTDGKQIVWPHYFDKTISRAQGRRVSLEVAVENPQIRDIAQAARSLGLRVEIEENARPPRWWHTQRGRVLLAKGTEPKETVLQQIARRL